MARTLTVRFTRISPTHHRFQYTRSDGTGESAEFETRSTLFHDLLHFAVETEAALSRSFYGLLLRGHTLTQFSGKDPAAAMPLDNREIMTTEYVVGPLSAAVNGKINPPAFLALMKNQLDAYGDPLPPWLTEEFIERVQTRMRQLVGHWNATPFGKALELKFTLPD